MSESLWTEPIAVIQQGAQYYLPFRIRQNGTVLSPDNVDGVSPDAAFLFLNEIFMRGENSK